MLGLSKGRGFVAASFSSTTPRPPFKGALVAPLLCARCKNQSYALLFTRLLRIFTPNGVEILHLLVAKIKASALLFTRIFVYLRGILRILGKMDDYGGSCCSNQKLFSRNMSE